MTTLMLCTCCDAIRDQERCFCANCGEATDSYEYSPSEREAYTLSQVEAEELAFTRMVPHSPYGFAVIDRSAA